MALWLVLLAADAAIFFIWRSSAIGWQRDAALLGAVFAIFTLVTWLAMALGTAAS